MEVSSAFVAVSYTHLQIPRAQALFELVVAAVKDDHIRVRDLLHHELAHVLNEPVSYTHLVLTRSRKISAFIIARRARNGNR